MIGIVSYGGYIPRLRLSRKVIAQNMAWYSPVIFAYAQGEKAVANWDEDALSMAVNAACDCLAGQEKADIDGVHLASTTLPYADRLNADILATALHLREAGLGAADFTGCLKAGTTALMSALDALAAGRKKSILVAAGDQRRTKMATAQEMLYGDGAAALLLGSDRVIAEFENSYSVSCDFADHYRGTGKEFDYAWEERWAREQGFGKIIPEAIGGFLKKTGTAIGDYDKIVYPCFFAATHAGIARRLKADPAKVQDPMHAVCGDTGAAHPLVLLLAALEEAKPGDRILVAGFGQGCDVLSFRVTEEIRSLKPRAGIRGSLANRAEMTNYAKYIKFRDLIEADLGIRGEANPNASLTILWRNRTKLLGLVGGKCRACGTPQYTFTPVCVNPDCQAVGQMDDYEFADKAGSVFMYTGDMLAASVDPPAIYGIVDFEGGGRLLADFTDCTLDAIRVGLPIRMSFRRRVKDDMRGFTGYFWKVVPQATEARS